ncbi:hypothetical protein JCM21900_005557 [Sporobolomyces salmonicolor]
MPAVPPTALVSFNDPASSGVLIALDSPWSHATQLSRSKMLKGKGPLEERRYSALSSVDGNALIEVARAEEGTPLNTLQPPYPSCSLLDASPSLFKSHLSTPLIPLGTPLSPLRSALKNNENDFPRSPLERIAPTGVTFGSPVLNPTQDDGSSNSSPSKSLRFAAVTSRRLRSATKKKKEKPEEKNPARDSQLQRGEQAEEDESRCPTARTSISHQAHATSASLLALARPLCPTDYFGPAAPATPSQLPAYLLPQTPSAWRFSPSTPSFRPHASYRDDELTDCDADYSLESYDDDESFSGMPSPTQCQDEEESEGMDQLVESMEPLGLSDEEDKAEDDRQTDAEEEQDDVNHPEIEDSVELTATELASDDDVSAVDSNSEPELEVGDVESSLEAADQADAVEELVPAVEGILPTSSLEELAEGNEAHVAPSTEPDDAAVGEDVREELDVAAPELAVVVEASMSPEALKTPSRSLTTSSNSRLLPSSLPFSSLATPTAPTPDARPLPVPEFPSTPIITPYTPQQTTVDSATPGASVAPLSIAPSALRPSESQVTDAPTAHRQLNKLTSLAAKRALGTVGGPQRKQSMTSIIPGSTVAATRRLVSSKTGLTAPSTSTAAGLPRPNMSSSRLATSTNRPRTLGEASNSSSSAHSGAATAPASTIPRPRTLLKSGLRPPSTISNAASVTRSPPTATVAPGTAPRSIPAPPSTLKAPSTLMLRTIGTTATSVPQAALAAPSRLARAGSASDASISRVPSVPSLSSSASDSTSAGVSAPRAPRTFGHTTSAPAVLANRGPSLPPTTAPEAAPRPIRSALLSRSIALSQVGAAPGSPTKRRPQRLLNGKVEVAPLRTVDVAQTAPDPTAVDLPNPTPAPAPLPPSAVALPVYLPGTTMTTATSELRPSPPRQLPWSPIKARSTSPRHAAPCSPLRSPRRIAVPAQPTAPTSVPPPSALVAPAEKLVLIASLDVFGGEPKAPAPARASRARRLRPDEELVVVAPAPRTTRRTAAASAPPSAPAAPAAPAAPLIPRSARRPPRNIPQVSSEPARSPSVDNTGPASPAQDAPSRPPSSLLPNFNPAPAVTQEELNRMTQRNTKKNQQLFNKLKIETVFLEENRPPSPTSKIRRSFGPEGSLGRPTTKEGREARAAKRRNALRSSTDGTEFEAIDAELKAEGAVEAAAVPLAHFRAPGDEEQYCSPVRPVRKGKKPSTTTTGVTKKRVRWDRALVYDGPTEADSTESSASGILKHILLDSWGNSTATSTTFAKPVPVLIRKRVFKDDSEQ